MGLVYKTTISFNYVAHIMDRDFVLILCFTLIIVVCSQDVLNKYPTEYLLRNHGVPKNCNELQLK